MTEEDRHAFKQRGSSYSTRVTKRSGAGEPIGEPATPPGILRTMECDLRRKLPDELVDELLAGADSEEEIISQG